MRLSKLFSIVAVIVSLTISGVVYADTCYDPNYNRYYRCSSADEFIGPVIAGLMIGAIIASMNNNNDDEDDYYRYREHNRWHNGEHRWHH